MAETWILNEEIYDAGSDYLRFYVDFQCNGERFDEFNAFVNSPPLLPSYDIMIANQEQNYKTIYSYYDGTAWWLDEAYRTIVLDEPASGDFLAWLEENAEKIKSVNKVVDNGVVRLDLTADTVTESDVKEGVTFHDASGDAKTGTAPEPSGNKSITAGTATQTGIDVKNYATVSVAPTPTETKTATGSGDVTPTSGKFLSKVTVPASSMTVSATKGSVSNHQISVTPKAVTNTAGWKSSGTSTGAAVTVSASELVSGSETKTENGTYDVTNLASVVVNVSGSGTLIEKSITQNGTYNASDDDADGYSKVTVAVSGGGGATVTEEENEFGGITMTITE